MSLTKIVLAVALCACAVFAEDDLVAEASGHVGYALGHGGYGHGLGYGGYGGYGYGGYGHGGYGHGGYGYGGYGHGGYGHGYGHGYHFGPFSYGYKGPHSYVDVSVKGPHAEFSNYGFKAGGYGYKHY